MAPFFRLTCTVFLAGVRVKVNGWISDVCLHEQILSLWPDLEELKLTFYDRATYTAILPAPDGWTFGTPSGELANLDYHYKLRRIEWHGLTVPFTLEVPALAALTTLHLFDVTWEGYGLLLLIKLARRSLKDITIANLEIKQVESESGMADYLRCVLDEDACAYDSSDSDSSIQDGLDDRYNPGGEVPPIALPQLKKLSLIGSITPALFGSLETVDSGDNDAHWATGVWHMPKLVECDLREVDLASTDLLDPTMAPLKLLGQNTRQLHTLNLASSTATPRDIHSALQLNETEVRILSIADTAASDQLLAHLPALTPRLAELDVRQCAKVSITSVARLAEAIRDRSDGLFRLERVRADWPEWGHAEFAAAHWLLFHGIWFRDEEDFEGLGPVEGRARRKWVREGKMDADREEREVRWRERVLEERLRREKEETERAWAEEKAEARRRRGEEGVAEGVEEVHYRVGRSEWGEVVLLERYEPGADGLGREGMDGVEAEEGSSDATSRSPSPEGGAARDGGEMRTPAQQQVPPGDRPRSAMSVVEHAG